MKQGILFGATAIAFGVLVSLLSFVLLPFCSGHGDMIMRCQKTSSVDGIIGIVIAIFGIAYIAIPKAQKVLSAAVIAGGVFTARRDRRRLRSTPHALSFHFFPGFANHRNHHCARWNRQQHLLIESQYNATGDFK